MSDCIYRQVELPIFQNRTYATLPDALAAPLGDVELVQDSITGLVHNRCFDASRMAYDEDYHNEQALSPKFREHLETARSIVLRNIPHGGTVVEIGCGKGFFLGMLEDAGVIAQGYDPAYTGENPRILKRNFGDDAVGDLVVMRHVLEHIPGSFDFMACLARRTKGNTRIYIEVPCFDWIAANNAFYDIFYEHCNYFTLDILCRSFRKVFEAGRLFGDQYIYVVGELATFRPPSGPFERYSRPALQNTFLEHRGCSNASPPYIWGAGAKGMTFANVLYREGASFSGLVDINPEKQNRFVGLSGLRIFSPQRAKGMILPGQEVIVMNPNYLTEIGRLLDGSRANIRCVA